MRDYELVYIVRSSVSDEDTAALGERVQTWIGAEGGDVQKVNPWGRRRLAYPIQNNRDGVYVHINFRAGPRAASAIERNLKLSEDVLRFMLIRPGA